MFLSDINKDVTIAVFEPVYNTMVCRYRTAPETHFAFSRYVSFFQLDVSYPCIDLIQRNGGSRKFSYGGGGGGNDPSVYPFHSRNRNLKIQNWQNMIFSTTTTKN